MNRCHEFHPTISHKLRFAFYIFCLIGCSFQIYSILNLFTNFQTTIEIKLRRPTSFDMPTISMCFDLENITKNATNLNSSSISSLNDDTLNYSELFAQCSILQPTANEVYPDCDNYSTTKIPPKVNYFHSLKCFTFFANSNSNVQRSNSPSSELKVDASAAVNQILLRVKVLKSFCSTVMVFLDDANDAMVSGQGNWLGLDLCKFDSYILSFTKTTRHLLPAPYETNCTNYSSVANHDDKGTDLGTGFSTRLGCVRDCLIRKYNAHNLWPSMVPAPADTNMSFATVDVDDDIGNYHGRNGSYDNYEKICGNECGDREDCVKITYNLKEDFKRIRSTKVDTKITIEVLKGLEETFIHNPKLDSIECVCYIGSAVSLWFGMSLITFADSRWLKKMKAALSGHEARNMSRQAAIRGRHLDT